MVPLLALLATIEGMLLLLMALHLLGRLRTTGGQVLLISVTVGGSTYVLLATILGASPLVLMAFPMPFMGLMFIVAGYALIKEGIGLRSIATLLPIGAFLLGAINLTYPVTVTTNLAPYLYGAGAVFRAMIFIGMIKYAFFQIMPPQTSNINVPTGAFYTDDEKQLARIVEKMKSSGNGVLITRSPPGEGPLSIPVFWVTRVASSSPEQNVITVRPTDMGILIDLVKRHIEKGHSLVVLDCFEYLVLENGFERALKFLLSLKDYVTKYGGTLIVATSPPAYKEREWKILSRELDRLEL